MGSDISSFINASWSNKENLLRIISTHSYLSKTRLSNIRSNEISNLSYMKEIPIIQKRVHWFALH